MRMLEVKNPEDIHAGCVNFFNYLDFFFFRSEGNFFYAIKYILRYSSLNIYTYTTNTCMLKTQVTIYHFIGNIDDKKNL